MYELAELLRGKRVVVLTGAGCSTESGIPDYRGPDTPKRSKPPMQVREFLGSSEAQRRYWARSVAAWRRFAAAEPNAGHRALASLERENKIEGIITQNVDRLHHRAGSRRIVELHGALEDVICLSCGAVEDRDGVQQRFLAENPGWIEAAALAPDGDVEIDAGSFKLIGCVVCGGAIKPRVVFFGENVPPETTKAAWALFDEAEVLLVVGSSLTVFSGYRFVLRASERSLPIAIVNRGPTRGDKHATVLQDAKAGEVLPALASLL